MRYLTVVTLGALLALGSAGSAGSQTLDNPKVQRCKSGMERGIEVCNNMHSVGSENWDKCLDYTIVTYQQCLTEALEHMETTPG